MGSECSLGSELALLGGSAPKAGSGWKAPIPAAGGAQGWCCRAGWDPLGLGCYPRPCPHSTGWGSPVGPQAGGSAESLQRDAALRCSPQRSRSSTRWPRRDPSPAATPHLAATLCPTATLLPPHTPLPPCCHPMSFCNPTATPLPPHIKPAAGPLRTNFGALPAPRPGQKLPPEPPQPPPHPPQTSPQP